MVNFAFHTLENTSGDSHELLAGLKKSFGFIPNVYGYMAEAPVTIEAYLALDSLLAKTSFTPAQQQIILLAISVENNCEFCMVAHQAVGKMHKANAQTLQAITRYGVVNDPQDRALAGFAQTVTKNRGRPASAELQAFLDAGYTKRQVFEVIMMVAMKTLSNYINHLTQTEPNKELLAML